MVMYVCLVVVGNGIAVCRGSARARYRADFCWIQLIDHTHSSSLALQTLDTGGKDLMRTRRGDKLDDAMLVMIAINSGNW